MDADLRLQLLRASVRDTAFLKVSGRDLQWKDFTESSEKIIAEQALRFWHDYAEPIGPLLRSYVDEKLAKLKLGEDSRKKLESATQKLCADIMSPELRPVSVHALQERVTTLRSSGFYEQAIEHILDENEKGTLTSATLVELVERANRELADSSLIARDVLDDEELDRRINRRKYQDENVRYPVSFIAELDKKIRMLAKGQVGLFLAPYSSGKGFALIHMTVAYAMQGLNVWHISLEDPESEIEDRIDSCMTHLPKSRLQELPNRLKHNFKEARKKIRGHIRITDWTEEDCTLTKIERGYEILKMRGFEPDVIIVDYDDEMKVEVTFKGESARRMEFAHLYRGQRKLAARLNVIWWTAAQTGRQGEGKKVITGRDTAEDISKIRKVALAIGIGGNDKDRPDLKHLFVIRHRFDRSRFGVDIMSNLSHSTFYDVESTMDYYAELEEDKKIKTKKRKTMKDDEED